MTKPTLMRPHVNMNGTTRDSLVRQRMDLRATLEFALKELKEMHPHGRDYQGGGDREADLAIWQNRYMVIQTMYNDLEQEALGIFHNYERL